MGTYDNVHLPIFKGLQYELLFMRRPEAAQYLYPYGIIGHTFGEGAEVLLGQDGGRHKHCHLFTTHHHLKGRPDGQLRLTVTHVPAYQAVHGAA